MEANCLKTFKIVALQLLENKKAQDIELEDGLIINKESEDGTWIIEAYIPKKYNDIFQTRLASKETFDIRVVITHADNDPAPFTVTISSIQQLKDHISVLFQGRLSKKRNDYSEMLLDDLIKEGYSGEQLLAEFKERMQSRQALSRQ